MVESNKTKNDKTNCFCFVLLHYNSIEDTIRCVDSIKLNFKDFNYRIVIVDNASPNKTGVVLKEMYSHMEDTVVLLSECNMGFAKGNNWGYSYCKEHFDPDFIIIANSDVEFEQKDFLNIVENKYNETCYSVLGPDIINTTEKFHQNPLRPLGMSLKEIKKGIRIRKFLVCANRKYGICFALLKLYRLLKHLIKKEKSSVPVDKQGYDREIQNCVLYGACFVFSPFFLKNHEYAFFPDTFMYFEEEFLWYMLVNNEEKTLYTPSVRVLHRVNGSTNYSYKRERERVVFKERNAIDSALKLESYVKSGCPTIW